MKMTRAAIYARKSTDDNDGTEVNKSVVRQVDHAKAYAEKQGWTVDPEHIFMDDGVSGKEFSPNKRRGLHRMMARLNEFDVVVMSDSDRLGREQENTPFYRAQIIAAHKRIFYYLKDEEYKGTSPFDVLIAQLGDFTATMERIKAGERSLDALDRKAANGHSPGGAVYGYDLLPVYATGVNGQQVRSHTDLKINKVEAAVLRGIFTMYADGHGHAAIAWTLNGNAEYAAQLRKYFGGVAPASPKQGKRGTGSWAPSSIRGMLYNARYAGNLPWRGKLIPRPDLRIIDENLWDRVQTRLKAVASAYIRDGGKWWGRPATEKHLLTGLLKDDVCGRNIIIIGGRSGVPGKRKPISYYGCAYHHGRGHTVCANDTRVRKEVLEARVIECFEATVLSPEAALYVIETAMHRAEDQLKQNPERPREIEAELRKLTRELKNLTSAIAGGKAPKTLVATIAGHEARIETLEQERDELAQLPQGLTDLDRARLRKTMKERMGRLNDLLHDNIPRARQVLQKTLAGPLHCRPVVVDGRKTFAIEGSTHLGPLIGPEVYGGLASPSGFAPYVTDVVLPIKGRVAA